MLLIRATLAVFLPPRRKFPICLGVVVLRRSTCTSEGMPLKTNAAAFGLRQLVANRPEFGPTHIFA
jgi:hypothetical protein